MVTTIDRDSSRKRNVWNAAEKKQILLICSELEIAGQLVEVCVTLASVSSPILILNLRYSLCLQTTSSLEQSGGELTREPFIRAVYLLCKP